MVVVGSKCRMWRMRQDEDSVFVSSHESKASPSPMRGKIPPYKFTLFKVT